MRPVARTEPLPHFVAPMLLETGRPATPEDGSWAVEVKFDGIRAQLRVDGHGGWCLRSRPGRNCTAEFPELAAVAEALRRRQVVLDGELVHFAAGGLPDFHLLRRRLTSRGFRAAAQASARIPATLVAFDVLHLDGRAVRTLPYWRRAIC
jgi:bifunctional non-homologous end joining protein LigD